MSTDTLLCTQKTPGLSVQSPDTPQPPTPENQTEARDKSLIAKLREPVDEGGFDGWYPDPLHVAAADRIEELLNWLGTEQSTHAAWRKRAEECEAHLLQQPASERCGECGHDDKQGGVGDGCCRQLVWNESGSRVRCGCECVYPATGAGEQREERFVKVLAAAISNAVPTSTEAGNDSHYIVPKAEFDALRALHSEIVKRLWAGPPAPVAEREAQRTIACHVALHGQCKRCGLPIETWGNSVCPVAPSTATTSEAVREAAEAVVKWLNNTGCLVVGLMDDDVVRNRLKSIISNHLPTGELARLQVEANTWRKIAEEREAKEAAVAGEVERLRGERLEIQRALASTVLEDPTADDSPPYRTREIVHGITSLDQRRRAALKRALEARANAIKEAVAAIKRVPVLNHAGGCIVRHKALAALQSLLDKKEGEDGPTT